ncbi:2-hydroxyacyl-CoA dehydratase subunit D [Chloroflexota bacterium]
MDTGIKSKAMEQFTEATETLLNPLIREWKEQGGKVIGYFCPYVPDEIITAAGFMPFRMRATGSTRTELADAYVSSINCSFVRHCFDMALRGGYSFIDGLVWVNSCDHVRRLYDNWKRKLDTPFLGFLSLPRKAGGPQVDWYREELANFKEALEQHFNVEITDERLWEAIKLHNETRRLQRQLYELRKGENPPITGAETLAITVAGTAMPRESFNRLLRGLLDDMSGWVGKADYRARLMIVGSILDDPAYIKVIEDQGGLVVTDSLCFGSRMLWRDVDEKASDPLTALAQYHIAGRPSCPRMYGEHTGRVDFLRDMVREFKVDGIIGERLVFCDNWAGESFMLANDFKEDGIPFLELDREYIPGGVGQLRTRVQAFLETLGR